MLTLLRTTITTNAKYLAVGVGAVMLFGGASTTVSLSDSSTPTPKVTKPDKVATEERKAETGARPTDTHGYCVSQAVAKAKVAGKTGQDIAAAAHSCPTPNQAAKDAKTAAKVAAKVAAKAAKAAEKAKAKAEKARGKSSTAPGRTPAP